MESRYYGQSIFTPSKTQDNNQKITFEIPSSSLIRGLDYHIRVSAWNGAGNTYGIPYEDSGVDEVYNTATPRGFFSAGTSQTIVQNSSAYTITSNYRVDMSTLRDRQQ
jgi:hypothetical protein